MTRAVTAAAGSGCWW